MSTSVPVVFNYSSIYSYFNDKEFTNLVTAVSFSEGISNFTDSVNPGTASIVINNNNNQASVFDLNTPIEIKINNRANWIFYVESIDYQDAYSTLLGAKATLQCISNVGRFGKIKQTSKAITQTSTVQQMQQLSNSISRPSSATAYGVTQGAQTYTGTTLQYLQTSQQTENNLVKENNNTSQFPSHIDHACYFGNNTLTVGPTSSTTQIAYSSISRNFLDSELANSVSCTPAGLSTQTATNASSVTLYGTRDYSRGTYDWATATALSNATWMANILSDRALQTFVISFVLEAQDTTALNTFLNMVNQTPGTKLFYRIPGETSLSYEWVYFAGIQVESDPSKTVFTITCLPANMYMPFAIGLAPSSRKSSSDIYGLVGTTRYNLLPDPGTASTVNYTGVKFGVASATYPFPFVGSSCLKATVTTGTAGQFVTAGDFHQLNNWMPVLPSKDYTFSFYIFTPTTNTANTQWRAIVSGYTIAGAATTSTNGTTTTVTCGNWTRLSVTHSTGATTLRLLLQVESVTTLAVGQVAYLDCFMLEQSATLGTYFDGDTRPAQWTGELRDSPSMLSSNYFRMGRTV